MSDYAPHPDPKVEAARVPLFEGWTAELRVTLEARIAARRQLLEAAGITEEEWRAGGLAECEEMLRRARRHARRSRDDRPSARSESGVTSLVPAMRHATASQIGVAEKRSP